MKRPLPRSPDEAAGAIRERPRSSIPGFRLAASGLRLFVPRLLLIEADAFGARAAIAERRKGAWQLGELAHSRAFTPAEALAELQSGLGGRLPRQAVLVSAACLPALADLPVAPAKPRSPAQMLEMVRYELEPLVAQHNNLWTLGEVLDGMGALDAGHRRSVAVALENRRLSERSQPYRFGEVAIAEGLASREQVDESLARQRWQQILDSEVACGWLGYAAAAGAGDDLPRWRAAVCAAPLREQWRQALAATGVRLQGILPALLLAVHPAARALAARPRLAVEIRPEQIACARYAGGRLTGIACEARLERPVDAGWIAELLAEWLVEEADGVDLVVLSREVDGARLAAQLEPLTRCETRLLAEGADAAAVQGFRALLAERDRERSERALPVVPPRPAATPLWKTRQGRRGLAALALLLGLVAWEGNARLELAGYERDTQVLRDKLKEQADDPGRALDAEAHKLDQRIGATQEELAKVLAEADRLDAIARRGRTLPAMIRLIGGVIEPEVILDGLEEGATPDADIGIRVQAWSISDAKAQRFAKAVQEAVRPLGLTVAQADLRAAAGRTGGSGYAISFWMIPLPPDAGLEESAPRAEATP